MNWSDIVTGVEETPADKPAAPAPAMNIKWSDEMTGGPSISTEPPGTNMPGEKRTKFQIEGEQPHPPGFGTSYKAGVVDDPRTKIDIFANARFPNEPLEASRKRYGMQNGQIFYVGDDNLLHPETGETLSSKTKEFTAETAAHGPAIALSTAATAVNPLLGPVGAGVGELIRKAQGALMFDEPMTAGGTAGSVGKEMALESLGLGTGTILNRLLNKSMAARGGVLAKAAGKDQQALYELKQNVPAMLEKEALHTRVSGSPLPLPATVDSKYLQDKWKLLHDYPDPEVADKIQKSLEGVTKQTEDAVYNFLDVITPKATSTYDAGAKVSKAADVALDKYSSVRSRAAKPFYDEARKVTGVDITSTVEKLQAIRESYPNNSMEQKAADEILSMLKKEGGVGPVEQGAKEVVVLEDNLGKLDSVKKSIDAKWKSDPRTAPEKNTQRELRGVLDELLATLDDISPAYKKGRETFRRLSPMVERQQLGVVGDLAKVEGDDFVTASRKLFSAATSSPETVAKARRAIVDVAGDFEFVPGQSIKGAEAWNEALKVHIQDIFETIRPLASGDQARNYAGLMAKALGSEKQMKIYEAAMSPEQFRAFQEFIQFSKDAGKLYGKESATATRLVSLEDFKNEGGVGLLSMAEKGTDPYEISKLVSRGIGGINNMFKKSYHRELADVITSDQGAVVLQRINQLPPGSKEWIQASTVFAGMVTGGVGRRNYEKSSSTDILPPSIQPPLRNLLR